MAFNFENSGNTAMSSPVGPAGVELLVGPDLEDIQTEVRQKTKEQAKVSFT